MAFFKSRKSDIPLTPDEALPKLENFCAYRERAPQEVQQKIKELGLRGDDAEQVFEVLREDGYFNEERYAVAYAGGKFRVNHWGRVRIRLELRQRGISAEIIQRALEAIEVEAYETTLREILAKKRAQYESAGDDQARQKTAAYAIRTGFEPELVFRYL